MLAAGMSLADPRWLEALSPRWRCQRGFPLYRCGMGWLWQVPSAAFYTFRAEQALGDGLA